MSSRLSDGRTNDLIRRFESLALIKSPTEDGGSSNNSSSLLESPTPPTLTKQPPVSVSGIRTSNLLYNSAPATTMNTLPVPSRISSFPELENTPPLVPAASTGPREHATPGATAIRGSNSVRTKAQMPGFSVSPMLPSNLPPTKFINNIGASPAQVPMAAGGPKPRRKSLLTALNQRARINSSAKATSKSWLKLAERYMDEARLHQESGDLENAYLKYMLCLNIMDKLPKLRDFDAISKNTTYERLRKEHVTRMVGELEQLAKVLKTRPYVDPRGDSVPDAQVDAIEQLEMMEGKFAQLYPDHQLARSASSTASLSPMYRPIQSTQPVADLPGNAASTALASTLESQWLEAQQQSGLQETGNRPRTIISRSRSDTLPGIAVINHGNHRSAMAISPNLASIGEDTSSEFIDPTVTTCMPLELWNLLDKSRTAANGRPTVLILDVRPHQDFVWGRIDHKYTVNIEPAVLHKGCTSADIESSLVLVSDDQQAWFRQRSDFDIVVYMSQSAHSFSDVGSVEVAALEALNSAIYHCEFLKPLKHQPLFLIGGFGSWVQAMGKHQCLWSDEARRSMSRSPRPKSVQAWSASPEPAALSVGAERANITAPQADISSMLSYHAPTGALSGSRMSYQTRYQPAAVLSPVPPIPQITAAMRTTSVAAPVLVGTMGDSTASTPVSGSVFDFFQQSNNYNSQWQQQQQQQQLQQQMDGRRQTAYTMFTQGYNSVTSHAATPPAPESKASAEVSSNFPGSNATSDRLGAATVDPAADNSWMQEALSAPLPDVPDNPTDLNQRSTVFDNPTYGFTGPAYSGRTNVNEYAAVSVPTDTHFATAEANRAEGEGQQRQQMNAEPTKKREQLPPIPTSQQPPKPEAYVQQGTLQTQTQQHTQLASHAPNAPLPPKPLEYANSPPANQQYQYQQYQYQQYQQQQYPQFHQQQVPQYNQQQQQYAQMQSAAANSRGFYNYPVAAGSDPSLNGRMHAGGNLRNSFVYNQAGTFAIAPPADPNYNTAPRINSRVPTQPQVQPSAALDSSAIGMTGLKNFGNTCFMNCVIQCLVGTVPFARYFLQGGWKKDLIRGSKSSHSDVVVEFSRLLDNMWRGQYGSLSPISFRSAVGNCSAQFKGNDQEDAQEFALFVLDTLHESLNRVHPRPPPDRDMTPDEEIQFEHLPDFQQANIQWERYTRRNWSIMTSIFQGQVQSRLACLLCKHTSTTYFTFTELSVPIPTPGAKPSSAAVLLRKSSSKSNAPVSIYQCLDAFSGSEILDGDNKWHCPRCKTKRKASKRMLISRLPLVLIVHLKRFSTIGHFREKLETNVVFPTRQLQMDTYMMPDARQQSTTSYNLYAVANHYGTLSSGHYTASVFNRVRGQWNYFDDTRVVPVSEDKVASPAAYLLFYVQNQ